MKSSTVNKLIICQWFSTGAGNPRNGAGGGNGGANVPINHSSTPMLMLLHSAPALNIEKKLICTHTHVLFAFALICNIKAGKQQTVFGRLKLKITKFHITASSLSRRANDRIIIIMQHGKGKELLHGWCVRLITFTNPKLSSQRRQFAYYEGLLTAALTIGLVLFFSQTHNFLSFASC